MSSSQRRDLGPVSRAAQLLAWCDRLDEIRDQARASGDDFLAYLVEAALEHAIGLAMRENGTLQDPDNAS